MAEPTLHVLTRAWGALDQPPLTQFMCTFGQAGSVDATLGTPPVGAGRRRRSRLTIGSGGVGGAELVVQGPDGCRAVGGWQCGEVGFQPA